MTKPRTVKPKTVDERLTDHLKAAEDNLVEAVQLFADEPKLQRRTGYLPRLLRAQELTTGLRQEELVRIRGEFRPKRKRAR